MRPILGHTQFCSNPSGPCLPRNLRCLHLKPSPWPKKWLTSGLKRRSLLLLLQILHLWTSFSTGSSIWRHMKSPISLWVWLFLLAGLCLRFSYTRSLCMLPSSRTPLKTLASVNSWSHKLCSFQWRVRVSLSLNWSLMLQCTFFAILNYIGYIFRVYSCCWAFLLQISS